MVIGVPREIKPGEQRVAAELSISVVAPTLHVTAAVERALMVVADADLRDAREHCRDRDLGLQVGAIAGREVAPARHGAVAT